MKKIFKVYELNDVSSDGSLIVVDVQTSFNRFMPENYIQNLFNYCQTGNNSGPFDVYQVWDSNRVTKPSYTFPNQKGAYEKKFGIKKYYSMKGKNGVPVYPNGFNGWVYKVFDQATANDILQKVKDNSLAEGNYFKMKDGGYLVYIGNNHKWFYVNINLYNLFATLKGKKVIIVGGAAQECLRDVFVSARSFGIFPVYNNAYIYSVKTKKY